MAGDSCGGPVYLFLLCNGKAFIRHMA
uniref:Uncharacterized protein n=1 Tax=Anguilla anguilla TaxID=7936 RepID=A0A0E9VRW8_ANGAN